MRFLLSILFITISLNLFARKSVRYNEFSVMGGITYYTGELNPAGHFNPKFIHPSVGLAFRRNFNSRWALKFEGLYGRLSGNDGNGRFAHNRGEGFAFTSSLYEISTQFEFNFFPFSAAEEDGHLFSPFVFAGIGGFYFNAKGEGNRDLSSLPTERDKFLAIAPAIPFGVGIKAKFSQRVFLTLEYGLRKTYTDYIDDVSTVYPESDSRALIQRGDSQSNDWYAFTGLSIAIRLGDKFTSCHFGQGSGKRPRRNFAIPAGNLFERLY